MLSKCANPECFETFRYLHQGRVFRLTPTPSVRATAAAPGSLLNERFWLCDRCAQTMTMTWDGKRANVAQLPPRTDGLPLPPPLPPLKGLQRVGSDFLKRRAAAAGREDR